MQEYISDRKIGKKLYRKTRKLYKRYKIASIVMFIILAIMVIINLWLVQKAENSYQIAENLFIGLGFDIVFVIGAFLARAFAISGGRDVLMSRVAEKCIFTDKYFILEYVPHSHETTEYQCIQFKIKYEDIKKIIDEDFLGRFSIYGTYMTFKYRTIGSETGMDSYTVSDMPIYVYGHYKEFDMLKKDIQNCSIKMEKR